jgi:predicted RecA/RadA family phage recombinase
MALFDFLKREHKGLTWNVTADIGAGEIVQIGDTWTMAFQKYVVGQLGVGVYWTDGALVPKDTAGGSAFAVGKTLWLDTGSSPLRVFNADGGGFVNVGFAIEPATDSDTHVLAVFDGQP